MELTAALGLIAAVVAPFVVALIVRPTWSADAKRNTAIGASVGLGVLAAVATGVIHGIPESVTTTVARGAIDVGIVVSLGQGFYKALKTPVDALAAKTSPTPTEIATGN